MVGCCCSGGLVGPSTPHVRRIRSRVPSEHQTDRHRPHASRRRLDVAHDTDVRSGRWRIDRKVLAAAAGSGRRRCPRQCSAASRSRRSRSARRRRSAHPGHPGRRCPRLLGRWRCRRRRWKRCHSSSWTRSYPPGPERIPSLAQFRRRQRSVDSSTATRPPSRSVQRRATRYVSIVVVEHAAPLPRGSSTSGSDVGSAPPGSDHDHHHRRHSAIAFRFRASVGNRGRHPVRSTRSGRYVHGSLNDAGRRRRRSRTCRVMTVRARSTGAVSTSGASDAAASAISRVSVAHDGGSGCRVDE